MNGQGKTNVIESVYLAGVGRSHRTSRDAELVRIGEPRASVRVLASHADGTHEVRVNLFSDRRKEVLIGSSPIRRAAQLMGHVPSVLFSPEDLSLIKEGAAERRRFLDIAMSQIDAAYFSSLQKYSRALMQRNRLLKQIRAGASERRELDAWDALLCAEGVRIKQARAKFIAQLALKAGEAYAYLTEEGEGFAAQYKTQPAEMSAFLLERRELDIIRCQTSVGPHRDDIDVFVNKLPARQFASQGQQRTSALSLKLAIIGVYESYGFTRPVLLLDDVLSELDPRRKKRLFQLIEGTQCIITCADETELGDVGIERVFHVKNGIVI
jgi:DNA replication and repair protein RecF